MNFTSTNQDLSTTRNGFYRTLGKDCPICGGRKGNCSVLETGTKRVIHCYDQTVLISTSKRDGMLVGREKFIRVGDGNEGTCSLWVEEQHYFGDRYNINYRKAAPEAQASVKNYRKKHNSSSKNLSEVKNLQDHFLSNEQIHAWFSKLQQFCDLNDTARQYLHDRGMTDEEIQQAGYFSWNEAARSRVNREFRNEIPQGFPGWNHVKREMKVFAEEGIVLPIKDCSGQILGAQIRHINPGDTKRYTWWSASGHGNSSATLKCGEKPIGVFHSLDSRDRKKLRNTDNYIMLCEGILKPQIAANYHSSRCLGAAGFNFLSSEIQFKESLRKLKQESPNPDELKVLIPVDAGASQNQSVCSKLIKVSTWLIRNNYQVFFVWYGQMKKPQTTWQKKQFGDIDEIKRKLNRLDRKFITPEDFAKIAGTHLYLKNREDYFDAEKDSHLFAQAANNDWELKSVRSRFITERINWNKLESGLIGVRSAMSTGKTESLKSLVVESENNTEHGLSSPIKTVLLGSRNALLLQTSKRIGASHKSELKKRKDDDRFNPFDIASTISLCVDSLLYLSLDNFNGANLVIDEAESVLSHLMLGATCSQKRSHLYYHLQSICRKIAVTGGRIILLDANLSARTLKFFDRMIHGIGNKPIKKTLVYNHYQNDDLVWDVEIFLGAGKSNDKGDFLKNIKNDRSVLYKKIVEAVSTGGNPFICTDSKDEAHAIALMMEQNLFGTNNGNAEGMHGLVITSDNMNEQVMKFLKNPKKWLEDNKNWCRYITCSPTVESGLSVEGKFFSSVFGVFFGSTSTSETQMQMLGRVRENVPRYIFCQATAQRSRSIENASEMKRIDYEPQKLAGELVRDVNLAGENLNYYQYIDQLKNPQDKMEALERSSPELWNTPYLEAWGELAANNNWNKSCLRQELIKSLQKSGHRITLTDEENQQELITSSVKTAKEKYRRKKSSLISAAPEISFEQALTLSESAFGQIPANQLKIQKAFLQDELPELEITEDIVYRCLFEAGGNWFRNIKRICKLLDLDSHKDCDRAKFVFDAIDSSNPAMRVSDLPISVNSYLCYQSLGLQYFVDKEKVWHLEDLKGFLKFAKSNPKLAKRVNLNPTKYLLSDEDAFAWANKMLETLGLKLVKVGEDSYQLDCEDNLSDEDWLKVYTAFTQKLKTKATESKELLDKAIEKKNSEYDSILSLNLV